MATSEPQKYVTNKIPVFRYSKKCDRYGLKYLIQLLLLVYCRVLLWSQSGYVFSSAYGIQTFDRIVTI